MKKDNLEPCQHCGSKNIEIMSRSNTEWWPFCKGCGVTHSNYRSEKEAIEAWNAENIYLKNFFQGLE